MPQDFRYCEQCDLQQPVEDESIEQEHGGHPNPRTFKVVWLGCGHTIETQILERSS